MSASSRVAKRSPALTSGARQGITRIGDWIAGHQVLSPVILMGGYLALWWWGFAPSRGRIIPEVAQAISVLLGILILTRYAGLSARLRRERTQRAALEAALAMARTVAHELNNPLAVTLGRLQLARQRAPADHPIAQDLDAATEGARRLQDAIQTLTTLREFRMDRRGFIEFPGQTGRDSSPSTPRDNP